MRTWRQNSLGLEVKLDAVYQDYQDFDGVKLPMRVITYVNGQKTRDISVTKVELLDHIDASEFADLK
jgi:hypothetical protein